MRLTVLKFLFILIFVIYSARLFSMQILSGEVYRTRAKDISRRTAVLPSQRGEIYDRNYTSPLVINRDSFAVSITPAEVPRGGMDDLIDSVSQIINVPAGDIQSKIPKQYFQLYQPVEIAVNVPFNVIAMLAERKNTLPGVSWQSKPVRNYGNAGSLSHILGYVGDITRDELTSLYNRGYQQGDTIGKAGIERQYDELLRGKTGLETRIVDVRGRRVAGRENIVRVPPQPGMNLVLTIDAKLQTLVEETLGQRIGSAVVLKPSTGEVLAMVSYPWYDPNIFTDGQRSDYQALASDPNKPFINRAIQSAYPPASTFKIIMTTAILAENVFPAEQLVLCQGLLNYGNRDWRCHARSGHGRLNLRGAMAWSCDIYYWIVGRDYLGSERIVSYSREFGLGEVTGIDLPGEIAGFIPTPQWKERRFHERWVAGDTMNISIGQGYSLVTPLQLANMVAMVVNDGVIYRPHILKEVRDPVTDAVVQFTRPQTIHKSSISPSVWEVTRRDMRVVVTGGTASPLNYRTVEVAGKTGTAEIGLQDRWHSWFVAFAPFTSASKDDQIVVSVIVEAANAWEWWATYATALIIQGYFANQTFDEAVRALGYQYLVPVQGRRE